MEDNSFYVRIFEPTEFRKNLLLSSRVLLETLKKSESINEIRNEKLRNVGELKKIIEEVVLLNRKITTAMPKTKFRQTPFKKLSTMTSSKRANLNMLESELGKIESKLGRLN
jgi:hypothetical protein